MPVQAVRRASSRGVCGLGWLTGRQMNFTIEHEREEDGRWLAEVPELSGVLAYGATADEAMAKAEVLALRVLAERLEHNETKPQPISIGIAAA